MTGIKSHGTGKIIRVERSSGTFVVPAENISLDPEYNDGLILQLGNDRKIYAFLGKAYNFAVYNDTPFPDRETAEKEFEKVEGAVAKGNYQLEFNPQSGYKLKLKTGDRRTK